MLGKCLPCERARARAYAASAHGAANLRRNAHTYRQRHPEKTASDNQKFKHKNPGYFADRDRHRRKTDPLFKLLRNMGNAMRHVARNAGKCSRSDVRFLGFSSPNEFKKHLESRFESGMHWHNYGRGGWVIDHIIPQKFYDQRDHVERSKCWNAMNLRPCWDSENSRKSAAEPHDSLLRLVPQEVWPARWEPGGEP